MVLQTAAVHDIRRERNQNTTKIIDTRDLQKKVHVVPLLAEELYISLVICLILVKNKNRLSAVLNYLANQVVKTQSSPGGDESFKYN